MSPEERQMLASLFDRVRATGSTQRDADAEAFINQSVREQPYAPYFLAQAVLIQEQGMKAAADRIQQLEARVRELEQQGAGNQPQAQSSGFLGGLGSLFGSQQQPQRGPAPQAPQQQGRLYDDYARNAPQPGPWGGQQQPTGPWSQQAAAPSAGGSFLRGALGTAAGVAGGVMLAESLSSLFSPHLGGTGGGGLGGLFGGTANAAEQPVQETIVNNNYFGNDDNNDQNDNDRGNVDYASDDQDDDDYDGSSDNGGDDSSFA
ncbi:DUF2076 domain-containing protein [Rhizobium calliandrae]|uniref:DUF2076 domain-containing protein n=1 Tax=Rhizobium calliandrae TaxID=1312182 RepID=A0ABT7KCE5_9HYPH|nr:DUF2076 domain-containing protein [Rhizobium calliandrae]MDL2405053.1 DUF2076 domain-containing protein [Rhizobium calliandrae]